MEKVGIENLKEALKFCFALGKAIKEAKENDGKFDVMDIGLAMKIIPLISPAIDDASKIADELKDLSLEELKEVKDMLSEEFDELISNDKLIDQLTSGIEVVVSIYKFVKTL